MDSILLQPLEENLWVPGFLRVFISHISKHKVEASKLKDRLLDFGVHCFIAHEDIQPSTEWQGEIIKALKSMDVLVALLTTGFNESEWTDQEVGFAMGRPVPVFSVSFDMSPYGFTGKYQAISGHKKNETVLAKELFSLFMRNDRLKERLIEAVVIRFENADNFNQANALMKILGSIDGFTADHLKRLENAPKMNTQVEGAFDVQQGLPRLLKQLKPKS